MKVQFTLLLSLIYLGLSSQCNRYNDIVFDDLDVTVDIKYGANIKANGDSMNLLMDILAPKNDTASLRPLVMYLHGGTFVSGDKQQGEAYFICEEFARRGYVAVSPTYRQEESLLSLLSGEAMIKAVLRASEDFKASLRWMYKSVIEDGNPYRIDTNHIIVGGASAGSIAVMHAIYVDDFSELDDRFVQYAQELGIDDKLEGNSGNPGYSTNVNGIINVSGALKDKNYMNNNLDIPIASVHNQYDFTIPIQKGHPMFLPFLPIVMGSQTLHMHAKEIGLSSELYYVLGVGHVPYNGKVQPIYDRTVELFTSFAAKLIGCDNAGITTPIFNQTLPQVKIYPNPVRDILNIDLSALQRVGDNYIFELYNLTGQKLLSELLEENQNRIDLLSLNLNPSIYLGQIRSLKDNSVVITQKVILE